MASLTAMTGSFSTPSFSIARRRMTPVVVSSMLATTSPTSPVLLGGREGLGPAADLGVDVVQPVQGDEDHGADEVGAVVHRDVRPVLQGGGDVAIVARLVLALDGVDGDAEVLHEAGGHVVLGRQRVGRDQHEVGAAGHQGAGQVGGLGRDVQAGATSAGPARGFSASNRSRIARRTGMSRSAQTMR